MSNLTTQGGPGFPGGVGGAAHSRVTAGRGGRADRTQGTLSANELNLTASEPTSLHPETLPTLKPLQSPAASNGDEEHLITGGARGSGGKKHRALKRPHCLTPANPKP